MTQLLAGDIGGTKTILRLVQVEDSAIKDLATRHLGLETVYENRYASGAFAGLAPMVKQFLAAAGQQVRSVEPRAACFAIAGPIVNNTSQLTNLPWSLSGDRLTEELQFDRVQLINDFEAVGYGVLGLQPDDIFTLQPGEYTDAAPIAIIGAGTGLGQGFLIHQEGKYYIFPSEGGHADFAPRSELEFQLLKYLLDKHSIARVSVERVVSGQGIIAIYQFLRDRMFIPETPEIAEVITTWERQAGRRSELTDPAAVISQAALAETDRLSQRTMELFIETYGAEAGNLALKLLPRGGLYIAGGVAAKNIELIKAGGFIRAFNHKGRVSHLLSQVPVHVVLNQHIGLIGAALKATRL